MERLCSELKVGGKYEVRAGVCKILAKVSTVEISGFGPMTHGVANCTCRVTQLVRFKGFDPKQFHPGWVIDCERCPCYDPRVDSAREDRRKYVPAIEIDPLIDLSNSEIDVTEK